MLKRKKLFIQKKFANHLQIGGKKTTSEKIILKSFKEICKTNKKRAKNVFLASIITNLPVFKINQFVKKRRKKKRTIEVPVFIKSNQTRVSIAIKNIKKFSIKKREENSLFLNLTKEILNNNIKQKEANLDNKQSELLKYYKWK